MGDTGTALAASDDAAATSTAVTWALAGLALLGFAFQFSLFRNDFTDDSYITLRFVENWRDGHGLVFNPGQWVEGYSCPLYVWLLCAGALVFEDLIAVARTIGVVSWGAALALSVVAARITGLRGPFAVVPAVFLAGSVPFGFFAVTGMETPLYAAVIFAAFVLQLARNGKWSWPLVIALWAVTFSRPEGALYAGAALVAATDWKAPFVKRWPLIHFAVFCAGVAAFVAVRYTVYGDVLPNTFYAKQSNRQVLQAVPHFFQLVRGLGGIGAVALIAYGVFRMMQIERRRELTLLSLYLAAVFFFQLWAGADWMMFHRFLVPAVPLLVLIMAHGFEGIVQRLALRPRPFAAAVVVSVAAWQAYMLANAVEFKRHEDDGVNFIMTGTELAEAGKWIGETYPDHYKVAVLRMGAIAYYSDLEVIDLFGLTDAYIARNDSRAVEEYVAGKNPELVVEVHRAVGGHLYETKERFGADYRLAKTFPQGSHQILAVYERTNL